MTTKETKKNKTYHDDREGKNNSQVEKQLAYGVGLPLGIIGIIFHLVVGGWYVLALIFMLLVTSGLSAINYKHTGKQRHRNIDVVSTVIVLCLVLGIILKYIQILITR